MISRPGSSELRPATVRYWRASLALGAVVIAVVVFLLETLRRTVNQIHDTVADIWLHGKLLANNTVHIPGLSRVNQALGMVLAAADRTAVATGRIRRAVAHGKGK